MMHRQGPVELKVWGDLACFTRPEMKVERVSYPTMTPSAARGVLEAIFWKPEFEYVVQEIWTLNPVRYFSIMRNEVKTRASNTTARKWERSGGEGGYLVTDEDNRTQRHTLALRDVAYLIRAEILLRPGQPDDVAKYRDQFRRRLERGQCYQMPYLGCREFTASFGRVNGDEQPQAWTEPLGRMLLDLDYERDERGRGKGGIPRFFQAAVEDGVLRVPARDVRWRAA